MRGVFVSVALLSLSLAFQGQTPTQTRETLSATLYSAAISNVSPSWVKQFLIVRSTVPYARTDLGFLVDPDLLLSDSEASQRYAQASSKAEKHKALHDELCNAVPDADRDAYVSAIRDYLRVNQNSINLDVPVSLPQPYRFLSDDEVLTFTHDPNLQTTASIFWVSVIGFSRDMNLGLVYVRRDAYAWGGSAGLYAFKQQNGKWQLASSFCPNKS